MATHRGVTWQVCARYNGHHDHLTFGQELDQGSLRTLLDGCPTDFDACKNMTKTKWAQMESGGSGVL